MMEDRVRRSEVFRYLGYGNRVPDEETGELAEECIKELLRVSEERICVREFPVTVRDGSLDCGCFQTSSRSLLKNLGGCARVLVMAATLLEIKAKMLLPAEVDEEGEEIDPRADLVERLLEYKLYKCMAEQLKGRQDEAGRSLYREADIPKEVATYTAPVDLDELLGDLTLVRLNEVFQAILRRTEDKIDPIRSKFGAIEKEEVSLEDKMAYVEEELMRHPRTSFRGILKASGKHGKMQVIVTFLAILELMKVGKLNVKQDDTFGEIYIEAGDALGTPVASAEQEE